MAETIYKIDGTRPVDKVSKTQRKKQMHELQDLGAELVELSKETLAKIPMSDALREAIREYKRLNANGAWRRQLQLIGKIMRSEDTEPIRAKLAQLKGKNTQATAQLHRLERLRNDMIADDAAITQFIGEHHQLDVPKLRALVRNARREAEQGKPPKSYRELFQFIKTVFESPNDAASDDNEADLLHNPTDEDEHEPSATE